MAALLNGAATRDVAQGMHLSDWTVQVQVLSPLRM